ncbi:DUF882 domain-containing protein [bacterium]|nr:DUF882 domain-containing protein [bacterium]
MNLNFKMSELIHSDIAIQNNFNNMPDINSLDNMLELVFYCLQPIRDLIKKPMIITSGYRSQQVNFLAGGAFNSQHKEGKAADFKIKGMTPKEIIEIIENSDIEYDQLINEYDKWVHVSFDNKHNRKSILKI